MILWLDVTHDCVVEHRVLEEDESRGLLAETFLKATLAPSAGPPRRPSIIRVATAQDAKILRPHLDDATRISVGPLPEIDALIAAMQENFEQQSEGRQIEPEKDPVIVKAFYSQAAKLWHAAPWRLLNDTQILLLHSPKLKLKNWVVSIIGALGESFGAMLFPSLKAYQAFLAHAENRQPNAQHQTLPTALFVINYDRGVEVSKATRQAIAKNGWTVAHANAYPTITKTDVDYGLIPIVDQDMLIAIATIEALVTFFDKHRAAIASQTFVSAVEKIKIADMTGKPTITVTGPHPEFEW
jgi:hypothetical protein